MSLKIFIVFLCAAIGVATGYAVMRSYKRNYEYLDGVCALIAELKRNIAYRRDGAVSVLRAMEIKSRQLEKNVGEYVAFAGGKADKPDISRGILSAEVYERTREFFASIGRSDGQSQINELDMFGERFIGLRDAAETKYKKLGGVAVKLGFLIGLGVGILAL